MKNGKIVYSCVLLILFIYYGISNAEKFCETNEKNINDLLPEEECSKKFQLIKKLLSTKLKTDINSAVEHAVKIPFDKRCNRVHYNLIDDLISSEYYPEKYNLFIEKTINGIEDPSMDYRTTWCLRYISADGKIDNSEWDSALNMVQKGKLISLPVYFTYLFTGIDSLLDPDAKDRLDDILRKAKKFRYIKSGEPASLLFLVIKGLNSDNISHCRLINWLLNKYSKIIPDTEDENRQTALIYSKMYTKMIKANQNKRIIEDILSEMIIFLKKRKLSEGPARILISTALSLERKIRHTRDPFYEDQLLMINRELKYWICYSLNSSNYMNSREKRVKYVKRNRISCIEKKSKVQVLYK